MSQLTITHRSLHYSRPATLADRLLAMPPSPVGLLAGLLGEAAETIATTLAELEQAGKLSLRKCSITGRQMFSPRMRATEPEPEPEQEPEPERRGGKSAPRSRAYFSKSAGTLKGRQSRKAKEAA